MTGKVKGDL